MSTTVIEETNEAVKDENLMQLWVRNFQLKNGHIPPPYSINTTKKTTTVEDHTKKTDEPQEELDYTKLADEVSSRIKLPEPSMPAQDTDKAITDSRNAWLDRLGLWSLALSPVLVGGSILLGGYLFSPEENEPSPPIDIPNYEYSIYQELEDIGAHIPPQ